jgi:hypothetical protein
MFNDDIILCFTIGQYADYNFFESRTDYVSDFTENHALNVINVKQYPVLRLVDELSDEQHE